MTVPSAEEVHREVSAWLADAWDPDLTVREWWSRLADSGYAHVMLPEHAYGKGWGRSLANAVSDALLERKAIGRPTGLGVMLAAPTIAEHGTPEQIDQWIPPILRGEHAWCQLFSEPNAGSDLAGLQTRAERDGDEWVINGQKVWTSGGMHADYGMLIARTDPEQPKHQGITYFAFDMRQPGVEVRPLREMSGRSLFSEVFIDDARVGNADVIGGIGNGWRVANTTLSHERASLGAGTRVVPSAFPGTIAGHLDQRAGDFFARGGSDGGVPRLNGELVRRYSALAADRGLGDDPVVRDHLARLYTLVELGRMGTWRARQGIGLTGGEGNLAKLAMSELNRQFREVGNLVIGADGMLASGASATGGFVQEITIFSPGPSIYGGTDQVQRNIIGERVLGLPKEPGPSKDTPFRDLPQN